MDLGLRLLDGDRGVDRLAQGADAEVEAVAHPVRRDRGAARDVALQRADVGGDTALRLFAAELVGDGNIDRLGHGRRGASRQAVLQAAAWLLWSGRCVPLLALILLCFAAPADAQPPAFNPAADYVTPGQDEPGYRAWVSAEPLAAGLCKGLQHLSGDLRRRRRRPDLAVAADRVPLAALRRAAVRGAADGCLAEHRRRAALRRRLCRAAHRRSRSRLGLSQPGAQRLRRRRARKHPQGDGRGRHGAAAAGDPRGADERAVHASTRPAASAS